MLRMISRTTLIWLTVLGTVLPPMVVSGQTMLGASRRTTHVEPAEPTVPAQSLESRREVIRHEPSPKPSPTTDLEVAAWQSALESVGYSPGIIDGIAGPKTRTALIAFQTTGGLAATGQFDAATRRALNIDTSNGTRRYVITQADKKLVGECPEDWIAKSKKKWLGFDSLASVAANHGQCSLKLLAKLNPGVDLKALKPGDVVFLPNVQQKEKKPKAVSVEVDFGTKLVRAFDRSGRLVGLFHCSIAKEKRHRPSGECRVSNIALNPKYLFKPESWPEVKGVNQRLIIPPGPRNPVGVCWIGLSIKGYGIHGTPEPELIGKTGSHGCIRLTNWHVLQLAEMLDVGAIVRFVDSSAKVASLS